MLIRMQECNIAKKQDCKKTRVPECKKPRKKLYKNILMHEYGGTRM